MTTEDNLAAAQIARGLREMGVKPASEAVTADSLRIAEPCAACLHALTALVERSLLKAEAMDSRRRQPSLLRQIRIEGMRSFVSRHPGHLPEGLLCATTCAELGAILRGEKDAVHVLFGGTNTDLLDQFYGDGRSSPATGWRRSPAQFRSRTAPARRAWIAHPGSRRGHRGLFRLPVASPGSWSAQLHFY